MNLKIGDIFLIKNTDIISKIIENIEHSQYSHSAIYVGNNQLIEAEGFEKTQRVSINKYEGKFDVYRYDNLDIEKTYVLINYLNEQLDSHYDYLLLFFEFLRYAFHIAIKYHKPFNSHICSTLVNDAYKSAGIDLCKVKFPSPRDLSESKLLRKIIS